MLIQSMPVTKAVVILVLRPYHLTESLLEVAVDVHTRGREYKNRALDAEIQC